MSPDRDTPAERPAIEQLLDDYREAIEDFSSARTTGRYAIELAALNAAHASLLASYDDYTALPTADANSESNLTTASTQHAGVM